MLGTDKGHYKNREKLFLKLLKIYESQIFLQNKLICTMQMFHELISQRPILKS